MIDVLRLADDQDCYCRLIDPSSGPIHVPITEIGSQGALLDTKLQFAVNDYIDITLSLRGMLPRPLFAHVVGVDKDGIRLRWLHFEPGDEVRLRDLLDAYKRGDSEASKPPPASATTASALSRKKTDAKPMTEKDGTRRVIRPSTVFTPFGAPAKPAPQPEAPKSESQRVGTRRVVRPSAGLAAVESTPPGNRTTDESGGNVVLEPTGGFKAIPDDGSPSNRTRADESGAKQTIDEGSGANRTNDGNGTRRVGMVGADGKLDIGASIRSKAKTVRASELAARHDKVRVLNMATIKDLIQEAVAEAVQHLTASIGDSERTRLLEEAEAQFQERLKAFAAEKTGAEAQAKNLNEQLRRAQQLLEEERKRTVAADQFTVSEAGLGEIEDKMRRVLQQAIDSGNVSPELQEQLRSMIAHILDSERERIRAQELQAQNEKIALLEKKINRLAGTLEETEKQRDDAQELARLLEEQGGGLRNVMSVGLKDSDAQKKRKLALMKEILEINRRIRSDLGIELNTEPLAKAPSDPAPAVAAKAGKPAAKAVVVNDAGAPRQAKPAPSGKEGDGAATRMPAPEPPATVAAKDGDSNTAFQDPATAIDPDDLSWEIKPIEADGEAASPSVKRIKVTDATPPPLERKNQGGS